MELTKEVLDQFINRDNFSLSQISKISGFSLATVSRTASKFGIVSKHMIEMAEKSLPIETIYDKYINQNISLDALHKEYKAPVDRIKRQLLKHYPDIKIRSMDEAKRPSELNNEIKLIEFAEQGLTCRKIGVLLDVKEATVLAAYRRLSAKRFIRDESLVIPKEDLEKLYWGEKLSSIIIAKMFGTSPGRVITLLGRYNISIRGVGGYRVSSHKELNEKEWLYDEYITNNRSMASIASEIHTSLGNIAHYLEKYDIPIRSKEEVYSKLNSHGQIGTYKSKFGEIKYDSLLELSFIQECENNGITSLKRPEVLQSNNSLYYPDFIINSNRYVEVKPKSESNTPGPNRRRLIKQILVAKKNNIDVEIWGGEFSKVVIEDIDKYNCINWKLIFNSHEECFKWLFDFGFHHPGHARTHLYAAIKKIAKNDIPVEKALDANYSNSYVIDLIKHFSPHFWHSTHDEYNPVSAAWGPGNQSVLKNAVRILWERDKETNIYGLLRLINKHFKDFTQPSIFKPWVAGYVYDKYLPNGGVVIDPCMGWGGRLLGCVGRNIKYHGFDLNPLAVEANTNLRKFVGSWLGECIFTQADSSICDFPDGDLLFTSPPYDACERYFGIDSSKTLTLPIFENIFKKFKNTIALNVPKRQRELCVSIGEKFGHKLFEELEMKTASFMGRERTFEPILIFK